MSSRTNDEQVENNIQSMIESTLCCSTLPNLLKLPATLKKRCKSKGGHYKDIQEGLCTKSVLIGARSVAWPEHEIDAINAARIAGMTNDQIRELVIELEAKRKMFARVAGGL